MKNRWWSYYIDMAAFLVGYFALASLALAADYYTVSSGATVDIDEFGVCKRVTNSLADDLFVPTKTGAEWGLFRTNTPTNVSLNICASAPGITVSSISSDVNESGSTATFTVNLDTQPTANVTIGVSSSDTGEGTVSPTSLTFTNANYAVPQVVTVTGQDDGTQDGNQAFNIITAAATSGDGNYNGLDAANLTLNCIDNDTVGIIVTPSTQIVVSETGTTGQIDFVLTSQPTNDVTFSVTSSDTGEVTVSASSITFTNANWSTTQSVTVTGVDDVIPDFSQEVTISTGVITSSDGNYNGINPADVTVLNADDDSYDVIVSPPSGLSTNEQGLTDSFTLVLMSPPTQNVTMSVTSTDTSEITVSAASVTFTPSNWMIPQTITVTGQDDLLQDGTQGAYVTLGATSSTDPNYSGIDPEDVYVANYDNDSFGFNISPSSSPLDRLITGENGQQASFTVALTAPPSADVSFNLTSTDTGEGTVTPSSLTFTSTSWNTPQTVTVTGVADGGFFGQDGPQNYLIQTGSVTSSDLNYSGKNPPDVYMLNLDNGEQEVFIADPIPMTTDAPLILFESGGTATFQIVLNSWTFFNQTLTLTSADTSEGTVSPSTLIFTSQNYDSPQTVTVTAVDDGASDGAVDFQITGTISGGFPYNGVSVPPVYVRTYDDESADFIVLPPGTSASDYLTDEYGRKTDFTIRLSQQPTADVVLTATSSDTSEAVLSKSTFTFTQFNWNSPQTFSVIGVDDAASDGDVVYSIQWGTATSSDGNWSGKKPADLNLTNIDNE